MRIVINVRKGIDASASTYFEKAKQSKKKLEGLREATESTRKKIQKLEKETVQEERLVIPRKNQQWFEKFRWFRSSEGFLCIGGRDATSNEIVVKKHTTPDDLVFHTELPGSPFFVIKTEGKKPKNTIEEAAIATASFSRAWRQGVQIGDVFYVKPDQLSKEAPSGEFVAKGAFMVRGKRNNLTVSIECAVGMTEDGLVMSGPLAAVQKHCKHYVHVRQGRGKTSDAAKKIRKKIGGELDDIIRVLPAGGVDISN